MSLIGLDIGTTGCKAMIFAQDGRVLAQARREYAVQTPQPGWAEQDAEQVWALAWQCLRETATQATDDPPVALALSCQGEAVIPVDRRGRALRPAILGMDTRTTAENAWLSETLGADALFQRTGMPLHTINTLPKLLWLQRHEPELWREAHQFLLYEDFFMRRLGGEAVVSVCLASRTQLMNLASADWDDDILARCKIERARLAKPAPPAGGVVGKLRAELKQEFGLAQDLWLVSGGHDQACAALGSGVIVPGLAMVSTGTAEVVEVAMESPTPAPALQKGGVSIYRHVVPGLYLAMTLNHSGGLVLRWFRDQFGRQEMEQAAATGVDAYDLLLEGAPTGPTRLLLLPHFAGSGTPTLDVRSKGALLGLTFATTKAEIVKAALEGLTYELRLNLDLLRAAGVAIHELHAVGGGARSALWLQIKADVCRIPLRVPAVTDAACLGAALLAGVGAGVYPDFTAAVAQTVRWRERIQPSAAWTEAYEAQYARYRRLYPLLAELLAEL
ncbi:FGGY-family carbohydrate kinase [Caldilinea sp.]|uniref:FGGY-family carbohydrate kinase n=1 Tax=Caldilinea sp. TaxID=2293560 RepID=UPI0026231733|nr:FGGY family carbohydrate kinase [uncultured Caldilinea sp.]